MADIFEAAEMIEKMVDGFQPQVFKALEPKTVAIAYLITEQMDSGIDGDGQYISPNYDNDPYFDQEGTPWYHRAKAYKAWKMDITPPCRSSEMGLPPRPDNVPNLYINGKFHSEIFATVGEDIVTTDVETFGDAPAIVAKFGERILRLSPTAIGYLNTNYVEPHIWDFFETCGWRE